MVGVLGIVVVALLFVAACLVARGPRRVHDGRELRRWRQRQVRLGGLVEGTAKPWHPEPVRLVFLEGSDPCVPEQYVEPCDGNVEHARSTAFAQPEAGTQAQAGAQLGTGTQASVEPEVGARPEASAERPEESAERLALSA